MGKSSSTLKYSEMQCYIEKWPDRERKNYKKPKEISFPTPRMTQDDPKMVYCIVLVHLETWSLKSQQLDQHEPFWNRLRKIWTRSGNTCGVSLVFGSGWVNGWIFLLLHIFCSMVSWQGIKKKKSRWPGTGAGGTPAKISLAAAINRHTERETER